MRRRICSIAALALGLALVSPASAYAVVCGGGATCTINGSNGNDTIRIGLFDTGGGVKDVRYCNSTTGVWDDMWSGTSTALQQNVDINGGQGGDDIRLKGSFTCLGHALSTVTNFNGKWIDIDGQDGNDTLRGGENTGVSYVRGGIGNDSAWYFALDAYVEGGSGDDFVVGQYADDGDEMYGDAGNDCLEETGVDGSGCRLAGVMDGGSNTAGLCAGGAVGDTGDCYVALTCNDTATGYPDTFEHQVAANPGCNGGLP